MYKTWELLKIIKIEIRTEKSSFSENDFWWFVFLYGLFGLVIELIQSFMPNS